MRKRSVLIVEDDFVFAKALFLHLQREGYNCTLEDHIAGIAALLDKGPVPDIFILDYELGHDMNGLDMPADQGARSTSSHHVDRQRF